MLSLRHTMSSRLLGNVARVLPSLRRMSKSSDSKSSEYSFDTLLVTNPSEYVFHVEINRAEKLNTMNGQFWTDINDCFNSLHKDENCRSIVLSAKGKLFTAGIDIGHLMEMSSVVMNDDDIARKAKVLKGFIKTYQDSFSSLEHCSKPVICAIHNACVGGGVDLITSADIRYCSSDAWFQIKEVDVGLAADVGTLQRMPKVIGNESLVRELAFTARRLYSDEALQNGLVSRIFADKESLIKGSLELATLIAEKSPVAVQATKEALVHARDHSVQEGLNFIGSLNMALLQSEDVRLAAMASMNKEKPIFAKL